jgi:hypothetical protein
LAVLGLGLVPAPAPAAEPDPHLAPLIPFCGRPWKGSFTDAASGASMVDVARWELILGGQAVRHRHSLNDGVYAGETIVVWDEARESLVYFYFTTAGFYTTGVMAVDDGAFVSEEVVEGSSEGVTKVRSTATVLPDGRLQSSSEYYKNGAWVPGHEITYVEDPEAELIMP